MSAHARALGRGQQLAQRQHAAQPPLRRRSCRSVYIASRRPARAIARTRSQRLLDGQRLGDRDELGRHQAAGGYGSYAQQLARSPRRASAAISLEDLVGALLVAAPRARRRGRRASSARRARAAWRVLIASRTSVRSVLVEVLQDVGGALGRQRASATRRPGPRGIASATSARSAGCISSVSSAHAPRRLVEQREDVGRQQRRDAAVRVRLGGVASSGREVRRPTEGGRGRRAGSNARPAVSRPRSEHRQPSLLAHRHELAAGQRHRLGERRGWPCRRAPRWRRPSRPRRGPRRARRRTRCTRRGPRAPRASRRS